MIGKDGVVTHAWEKVKAAEFPGELHALLSAAKAATPTKPAKR